VGFAVTLHYIYVQISNPNNSLLKIYEIGTYSNPKLIYNRTDNHFNFLMDTNNYYANADHIYVYGHLDGMLRILEYRGMALKFSYQGAEGGNIRKEDSSKPYEITVTGDNLVENVTFYVTLRNFSDKSVHVDYDSLQE
jgi:hypothetical protein